MSAGVSHTRVRRERARPPEAERLEILRRRRAVCASSMIFTSSARLGEMNQHRHVRRGSRAPATALSVARVERIHRVRRDGGHDQIVACELLDERLGAGQPVGRRLRVGDRELDDRLTEHRRAGPASLVDLSRCRLRSNTCRRRSSCPDSIISSAASRVPAAHELRRHRLRLGRKDVLLQPVHQRQVVGEAAIQDHRRVRVRVDQAGHDDLPGGVDRCRGPRSATAMASGVSMATMSRPSIATAPGDSTRPARIHRDDVPPVRMRDTCSARRLCRDEARRHQQGRRARSSMNVDSISGRRRASVTAPGALPPALARDFCSFLCLRSCLLV